MKNLNKIAEELFNQIRSRFSNVTIGDENAEVINEPEAARYFDFVYSENDNQVGNVSVSLDEEEGLVVMFANNFGENAQDFQKDVWYNFLKELRTFAKKRLLNFEVRDINKSSLQKRDYKTLANNRSGEVTMAESKMYGTHKTSFQKIGNAKLAIKHSGTLDENENRTKKIGSIFIENAEGEKFKYPFKHLAGARAMALHVSEGGHPYDDFGKHITSLSEELSNLRKFKTYMGRSSVMAESLAEHMDTVNERMVTVKKTVQNLQKPNFYKEAFENFVAEESVQVPDDVAENWIDQLTVKQFNEELKDVFPYIYKLVGESTKAKEITFEDIFSEEDETVEVLPGEKDLIMFGKRFNVPANKMQTFIQDMIEVNGLDDASLSGVKELMVPSAYIGGDSNIGSRERAPNGQITGSTRGFDTDHDYFNPRAGQMDQPDHPQNKGLSDAIEYAIETLMGQFASQINENEEDTQENFLSRMIGAEGVKPNDFVKKAMQISQRYENLAFKNKIASDPNRPFNGKQGGTFLIQLYMELINMSREIQKLGGGNKTMKNAQQQMSLIRQAMAGSVDNPEAARLMKAARYEPKFIIDFVKQDIQSIGNNESQEDTEEGNAYAKAVRMAKFKGAKKGDEIDGPDGEKITIEKDQKTPLGEFILSYFDRETGQFPKGPTAVLTMVEKEYGERFVRPAQEFIERIDAKVAEVMGYKDTDMEESKIGSAIDTARDYWGSVRGKNPEGRKPGTGAAHGYMSYIYDFDDAAAVINALETNMMKAARGSDSDKASFMRNYIDQTWNLGDYLRAATNDFSDPRTPANLKAELNKLFKIRGRYKGATEGGKTITDATPDEAAKPLARIEMLIDMMKDAGGKSAHPGTMTDDIDTTDVDRIKNLAGM